MRRPRFVARGPIPPAGRRPDPDRRRRDGHAALVAGRGRRQGQARPRLACRLRLPLARSPGARRHRHAGQLLHRAARRPHQEPGHGSSTTIPPWPSGSRSPPDAKSATFTLRKGIKFHNGDPVTPQDVKFSYENYRGAKADVFKKKTERVEIVDDRTIRFVFKEPFLDFAILFGTANVAAPRLGGAREVLQAGGPGRASSRSPSARAPTSSSATSRA